MTKEQNRIFRILKKKYNTAEKVKSRGEVFTPFELINEILDKLPEEVWTDKEKKWFDPGAGLGNFHSVVLERLEANGIDKKHILENQLYFVELNPESAAWIKTIFDIKNEYRMNIICANTLTLDLESLSAEDWKEKMYEDGIQFELPKRGPKGTLIK